jgi:hypothetical protein
LNGQRRRIPGIVITMLFAFAMLFLALCMNRTINVYDEGLILFGAARVLDGAVPHRDFYANYGPGQFYVLAALYKIFGASVLVERAWDTFVRSCIVVLVFVIVDRLAPRAVAVLTAIFTLVFLGSLIDAYGYPVFPALAAALAGLAFLLPSPGCEASPARLMAAGGCAGVAMLFRYDVGAATFGAEIAILALDGWFQRPGVPSRLPCIIRVLSLYGLGFAIVVVPVAIALTIAGALPDLAFDVVAFPARFYAKTRSLPFPNLSSLLEAPSHAVVYFPFVMCIAALPAIVGAAQRQKKERGAGRESAARRSLLWTLAALTVLTLVYLGKGMVRTQTTHMAMAIVTSLTLAGLMVRAVPEHRLVRYGMSAMVSLGVAALLLFSVRVDYRFAGENIAWVTNLASSAISGSEVPMVSGSCRMPAGLERLACFRTSPEMMQAILYVRQQTSRDDTVFIGLPRHDKIFVNDVLLYFAMARKSATKWYHFDPGLQTSAPIQREMIGELQRAKPKLVVMEPTWAASIPPEPNDSAVSSGVTLLDDYIREAYEPVATFRAITVLRLRSVEPAAPAGMMRGMAGGPAAVQGL